MRIRIKTIVLCVYFFNSTAFAQKAVELSKYQKGSEHVTVFQSDMGGGGYITGIVQDPKNVNILYARSDVAGVFKSFDGGKSWNLKNSGLNKMSDNYCHSLAMDPYNSKLLLRASGDVRGFKFVGRIHRSVDGGESWNLVADGLDYYGNGSTRMFGELIAFNPLKKGKVAAGTYSKGVWLSDDEGKSWKYGGLKDERIASVQYHNNVLYVATIDDKFVAPKSKDTSFINKKLRSFQDKPRYKAARIYISRNQGKSWEVLFERDDILAVYEMVILDKGRTILFTSITGVHISLDGGKTFNLIKDLPNRTTYRSLTQSPLNTSILYAAEMTSPEGIDIPIYRSEDKGKSWKLISKNLGKENLHLFPSWHGTNPKKIGDARISHILPDYKNPNKLYISNWWGVTITEDLGKNYYGNFFKGIGIICCEGLVRSLSQPNKIVAAICDHAPAMSNDDADGFNILVNNNMGPARVVCLSKSNPDLLLYAAETKGEKAMLCKSVDGGKTAIVKWKLKSDNFIQDIKEHPLIPGCFWAYVEGTSKSEIAPGIYVSMDEGDTWKPIKDNPFASFSSIPMNEYKIESDLLPIVNYQDKNGCGTGQLISFDYFQKEVAYVGEWTSGVFRTTDGGTSWEEVGIRNGLPFDTTKNEVLQFIYTHPYKKGTVYAGFWNKGVWQSDNFGETWKQLVINKNSLFNASSMHIDRDDVGNELIVVAASNHPLGDYETALLVSSNNGEKWTDIYDNSVGCLRFISVVADTKNKTIYTATAGNGVVYYKLK
jgi:photosystem II stability/assembly factor-like uncharacterized protein